MDVTSLTDAELRQALMAFGVTPGPIMAFTRPQYERKLRNLQTPPEDAAPSDADAETQQKPPEVPPEVPLPKPDATCATDPQPEPKSYFGVSVPLTNLKQSDDEVLVFGARQKALEAVKAHPGARFKEFPTRDEAVRFASEPAPLQNPALKSNESVGVCKEYRGPKTPELTSFRRLIEKGQLEQVRELIWSNPRYLISGCDTPVILQEGCRYNALHVCAQKNQAEVAVMVLEILEDESFMSLLFTQDTEQARSDRINHMLDLYLNMPNKGNCETPLHFACKFGNLEMVKVLLNHPLTNRLQPNDLGKTPEQVICTRAQAKSPGVKKQILNLIQATCFVPLLRPADKSGVAVVGDPRATVDPVTCQYEPVSTDPTQSPLVMDACAGPMSPSKARDFRRKWLAHTSHEARKQFLSICCKDNEKGQERIGRMLAQVEGIGWSEYWEFLEAYADLSTEAGLTLLENHLEQRVAEECLNDVSSNLTLCGDMSSNTTLCGDTNPISTRAQYGDDSSIPSPRVCTDVKANGDGPRNNQDDSFTEKLGILGDQFSLLTLLSPTSKQIEEANCALPAGTAVNPWREKCTEQPPCTETPGGRALGADSRAAPPCPEIPEFREAMKGMFGGKTSPLVITRKRSDLESEGSDFISCGSAESDQSFETYYTASNSPPLNLTPPATPSRRDAPVFLLGPEPSKVDSDVLHALGDHVITPEHPNVCRWHKNVSAYSEEIRNKWSSPRTDRPWSTSQRFGAKSRLSLYSPLGTPTHTPVRRLGHTPGHAPGHAPGQPRNALQTIRTNLFTALDNSDNMLGNI